MGKRRHRVKKVRNKETTTSIEELRRDRKDIYDEINELTGTNVTQLNKKILELETKMLGSLTEEAFNEEYGPWIEATKKQWEFTKGQKWPYSEEQVVESGLQLKKEGRLADGVKIIQSKLNKNAAKLDYVFKFNGKNIFVEVKQNLNARLGSFGLHFSNILNGVYINDKHRGKNIEEKYLKQLIDAEGESPDIFLKAAEIKDNGRKIL